MSRPNGGTGNRTREERERDLNRVAELRFAGKTQQEIAETIGVSQAVISRDVKELRKRWQKETASTIEAMMAEELRNITRLQSEYWDSYKRSLRPRRSAEGEPAPDYDTDEGDPRFLQGVERCIAQRVKLLGIEPPQKVAPTTPDGKDSYQQHGVLVVPATKSVEEWLGQTDDNCPEDDPA